MKRIKNIVTHKSHLPQLETQNHETQNCSFHQFEDNSPDSYPVHLLLCSRWCYWAIGQHKPNARTGLHCTYGFADGVLIK